jgi:hypothetical protein
MDLKRLLILSAKATFHVVSRTAFFTALGVVLNLCFLLMLLPDLRELGHEPGSAPAAHAGPVGAVLAVVVVWGPGLLLILAFVLALPACYFVLGQKHGLRGALLLAVGEHKSTAVTYLVERLFAFIRERPHWVQRINDSGLRATLNEVLPVYLEKLDNLPSVMRRLFRLLVGRVDFRGLLLKVVETHHIEQLDVERMSAATIEEVDAFLDERFFQASLTWLWVLLGLNTALAVGLKLAL